MGPGASSAAQTGCLSFRAAGLGRGRGGRCLGPDGSRLTARLQFRSHRAALVLSSYSAWGLPASQRRLYHVRRRQPARLRGPHGDRGALGTGGGSEAQAKAPHLGSPRGSRWPRDWSGTGRGPPPCTPSPDNPSTLPPRGGAQPRPPEAPKSRPLWRTKLNHQPWVPDAETSVMGRAPSEPPVRPPRPALAALEACAQEAACRTWALASVNAALHSRSCGGATGTGAGGGGCTEPHVPRDPRPCPPNPPTLQAGLEPFPPRRHPHKRLPKAARAHLKVCSAFGEDPWVTLEHGDASLTQPTSLPPLRLPPQGGPGPFTPQWPVPGLLAHLQGSDNDRNHLPLGRGGHQA